MIEDGKKDSAETEAKNAGRRKKDKNMFDFNIHPDCFEVKTVKIQIIQGLTLIQSGLVTG